MKAIGQLQPILVKRKGDKYEVEVGHRRFLAAQMLSWDRITAIVLTLNDDDDVHIERAHENLIRENLDPIEEAEMVRVLVYEKERGVDEAAKIMGKSTPWVEKRLDILEFPEDLRLQMQEKKLSIAQATELAKCRDPLLRESLLSTVITAGASAATIRNWIHNPEVDEQIKTHKAMSEALSATPLNAGTLSLVCHLCQKQTELARMKHVWLCPGCMVDTMNLRQVIMEDNIKKEKEIVGDIEREYGDE